MYDDDDTLGPIPYAAKHGLTLNMDEFMLPDSPPAKGKHRKNRYGLRLGIILVVAVLLMIGVAVVDASAKAVRIEKRDTAVTKTLAYVEPFKVRKGTPKRLYVEFSDGSSWVFTPCKYEDSRNCFWWAPARGNKRGHSFLDLRGTVHYL